MPNAIATLMLLLYPAVAFWLFKRLPKGRALIWSFLFAYLILPPEPAAIDFPLMPPLNKQTLPNLIVAVLAVKMLAQKPQFMPDNILGKILMVFFVLGPIGTVLVNPEPIIFPARVLPGLAVRDIIAFTINQGIVLVGFMLARSILQTQEDQRDLLIAFLIAGLAYSLPILVEVRLSPQLNLWVYGYYQGHFEQSVRANGFRPSVFLVHGIWVAFFAMLAAISALTLARTEPLKSKKMFAMSGAYMAGILVLCKTLAPMLYGMTLGVLIWCLNRRSQIQIAALLAVLALAYPMAKGMNLVPEEAILTQADKISSERANSLKFRFDNEEILLERAMEKPVFGWGSWGRNHIRDSVTGAITSVSDGRWIIVLGLYGWVGFLAEFGLLTLPIFLIWRETFAMTHNVAVRRKAAKVAKIPLIRSEDEDQGRQRPSPYLGPMCLLLAFNTVDLLPNATLTPMTFLIAGALMGHAERLARLRKGETPEWADMPESKSIAMAPVRARTVM